MIVNGQIKLTHDFMASHEDADDRIMPVHGQEVCRSALHFLGIERKYLKGVFTDTALD